MLMIPSRFPDIMRSHTVRHLALASIAAFAPIFAGAQPAPPPPQLEVLEEGPAAADLPAAEPRKPRPTTTTESRAPGGRVTEVQVNSGNSTYYLRPNTQSGSAIPGDGQSSTMRAPQWQIMTFDRKPTREEKEAAAARSADVPPPPDIAK